MGKQGNCEAIPQIPGCPEFGWRSHARFRKAKTNGRTIHPDESGATDLSVRPSWQTLNLLNRKGLER